MKIELRNHRVYVDGSPFAEYSTGCIHCNKNPYIKRSNKVYKIKDFSNESLLKAVKEIICKESNYSASLKFAEDVMNECLECFNNSVIEA